MQEVCDRISVLNLGKKILEGNVETLIRDQQRLSFTVQNLPDTARAQVEATIRTAGGQVLSVSHPQTTLESLFLDALKKDERGMGHHD